MELKSTKHIVCILIAYGMDDVMREIFLAILTESERNTRLVSCRSCGENQCRTVRYIYKM